MWKKGVFSAVKVIQCSSVRLAAISVNAGGRSVLIFSVYMPTDDITNLPEFTECLSEVCAIIETQSADCVFVLGDFNAHPGELFFNEMCDFCVEQSWRCADIEWLGSGSGTYTFISDANGSSRWLDHCLVAESAWLTVVDVEVKYDTYWSDHFPVIYKCNVNCNK